MVERLKHIWAGFEEATTRRLIGGGVENIFVPHRVDFKTQDKTLLPEDFDSPAAAAFTALRAALAEKEKKFGRKRPRGAKGQAPDNDLPSMTARKFNGDELIKGLQATAMRTERQETDYTTFAGSDAGKAVLKKYKKKRFGIF